MKLRIMSMLFAMLVLLAGCVEHDSSNIPTAPSTAVEQTAVSTSLDGITLELPDYIARERVSETVEYFYLNGNIVGGIAVLDDADDMDTMEFQDYVDCALDITKKVYDTDYDYMAANEEFCHTIVSVNSQDGKEFYHYFYKGENAGYDVWIDNSVLNTRDMRSYLKSLHSEDLYNPQDQMSESDELPLMNLRYTLPDGITRQPTMTTRDLFYQGDVSVGGVEQIVDLGDTEHFESVIADLMHEIYNAEFTTSRVDEAEEANPVFCCQATSSNVRTTHYIVAVGNEYYDVWANDAFIQPDEVLAIAESCQY